MEKTLKEIVAIVGGELIGDETVTIKGVTGIENAQEGTITFIANSKYLSYIENTKASAIVIDASFTIADKFKKNFIKSENPSLIFSKIIDLIMPRNITQKKGIHATAVIGERVTLAEDVVIHAHAVIEDDVTIGKNTIIGAGVFVGEFTKVGDDCLIYPNVTIRERIYIGSRVIIHSGTVVGCDGFGFIEDGSMHQKIPQVGTVIIEDDVEIGSNVTIDRARFDKTVIGKGTKIDNLVQIAHNVQIGKNSIIVSQTGISGSTKIGENVILAGQSGIAGHLTIGDKAIVGAQAGVTKNVSAGEMVSGYPAMPHMKAKRLNAYIAKLPDLNKKINKMEEDIRKVLK